MNHTFTSICTVSPRGQTYGSRPRLICPCSQDPCHTSRSASRTLHCHNEILRRRTAPCGRGEELDGRTRFHIAPPTHQNRRRSPGRRHRSRDWAHTLSCCSGTRAVHRWAVSTSLHRCRLHSRRHRRTRRPVLNTCGCGTEILLLSRTSHLRV